MSGLDQSRRFPRGPPYMVRAEPTASPSVALVDLQRQRRLGMAGIDADHRPAGRPRLDPAKPEASKIELIDKNIDHPNRIVVTDPVFQPLGNNVLCVRPTPSTKRFIKPSRQSTGES